MSKDQLSESEVALLLDLARLLKKHGPETFTSLASSLADSGWSADMAVLLESVARSAPKQRAAGEPRRSRSTSEKVSTQLERADESHLSLLRPIADKLLAGEALPRLKDVVEFAATTGISVSQARSRGDAIVTLVRAMVVMPMGELEGLVREIGISVSPGQRSLGGWNQIIERSRAATTDRRAP
jgi:hypothetical protein